MQIKKEVKSNISISNSIKHSYPAFNINAILVQNEEHNCSVPLQARDAKLRVIQITVEMNVMFADDGS